MEESLYVSNDLVSDPLETKQVCYHCDDDCDNDQILFDDKVFCCHGCKAVYELINQSDLTQYYQNESLKAEKIKDNHSVEKKYAFLKQEEVTDKLIKFRDEKKSIVKFYLSGIHCSSCIYLLEHLNKLNPHILRSEVNFIRKEITLTFENDLPLNKLVILLASLGYEPTINLDSLDQKRGKSKSSDIGIKIAVAGFCFGNSMLISLPEYLDVGFQIESTFRPLFGWINLILSLPVVFYSARDYYKSAWVGLRHRYLNIDVPITLGILTLFIRSISEILFDLGSGYVDSLNGLVFFLLIGKWYQGKSYQALSFERDYKSYFPVSVSRIIEGIEEIVLLKDLTIGDRIVIHNQELIPADGIIESGDGKIDYSFVTGEAEPVSQVSGSSVFAGGKQIGAQLIVRLTKTVSNSELTQLWNDQGNSDKRVKYDALIDHVSKYFTITILMIALITGVYWGVVDPSKVWNSVASILIVACPCALALALPFGLGHGMRVLGSKGFYLKNASVIERMSKVDLLVFDKTGTLTQNDATSVVFVGDLLSDKEKSQVKSAGSNSAHPLSKLIANHIDDSIDKVPVQSFDEEIGKGTEAIIYDQVIRMGSADWVGVASNTDMQESRVYLNIDSSPRGYFRIKTSYRKGIFESLEKLKNQVDLHLLSGDNDAESQKLKPFFSQLQFNQKPKDKLEYIQSTNRKTLMIGDGLNDAGALKAAEVGVSVCEDIHQFSPACDALLQADSINSLSGILNFSKSTMVAIFLALMLSFAYNIVGLSFAVTGNLLPVISAILMPLSSITVVGFITAAVKLNAARYFGRAKTL
ncbi:MAG: heavy metal translocating P-type ATPase metal-binding domain-containing protein [Cyclobacteriaceae bacterium]